MVRAACLYRRLGWWPVALSAPLLDGTHQDGKKPFMTGWQKLRLDEAQIAAAFRANTNLGLLLGAESGHLLDVDLDTPQSVACAYGLLPPTPMRMGRKNAGVRHLFYHCPDAAGIHTFTDPIDDEGKPDGQHLVQLRYSDKRGLQTMVPPSVHGESGDLLVWLDRHGHAILDVAAALDVLKPATVAWSALMASAQQVALCALLARAMPAAGQHDYALALCGYLARYAKGALAANLVRGVIQAAGREIRLKEFQDALTDAQRRLDDGSGPVQGKRSLAEFIGDKRMQRAEEWLGVRDGRTAAVFSQEGEGGQPQPRQRTCSKCGTVRDDGVEACPSCGAKRSKLVKDDNDRTRARVGVNAYKAELELLLNLTDEGNAERFLRLNATRLLHCDLMGGWYAWDGKRWAQDTTNRALELARECARAMRGEALALEEDVRVKAPAGDEVKVPRRDARALLCHWAGVSSGSNRLAAMLELSASDRRVAVLPDGLDADPWLLNVSNYTLPLGAPRPPQQGLLGPPLPHDPALRITKLAPVDYDPQAVCPRWEQFLAEVFLGDAELIAFMQRLAGYCLFGGNPEQVIVFLWGEGANGKGVFKDTLAALLGDYAATAASETILAREGGSNNQVYALAQLKGARLVTMSETDQGRKFAESVVKVMTGGDPISARKSHQDFFTFTPEFLPVLATNHMPELRNVDYAIRRRVLLVPFRAKFSFEAGNRDLELPAKLRAELPGILNWALAGLLDYHAHVAEGLPGLAPPAAVSAATAEYFEAQDPLAEFLADCCILEQQARCTKAELYKAYQRHCEASGINWPLKINQFGGLVKPLLAGRYNLPPEQVESRTGAKRWWHGIALNAETAIESSGYGGGLYGQGDGR